MHTDPQNRVKLVRIEQLSEEIFRSVDPCNPLKIHELDRIAIAFPFMDLDRNMMRRYLDKLLCTTGVSERIEIWNELRSHAHKVGGLAAVACRRWPAI